MAKNPFKERPSVSQAGSATSESIYLAVGHALSTWEHVEGDFAHLFGFLIKPEGNSFTARRAYGNLASGRARSGLISEASKVFFRDFPSEDLRSELKALISTYDAAAARRNEIAHGLLMPSGPTPKHRGFYLAASVYSAKRELNLNSPYYYTSADIDRFRQRFAELGVSVHHLIERLMKPWREASVQARKRH